MNAQTTATFTIVLAKTRAGKTGVAARRSWTRNAPNSTMCEDERGRDRRCIPGVGSPDPAADQQKRRDGAREHAQAEDIDLGASVPRGKVGHRAAREDQRERTEREVYPKAPPPVELDQEPTEWRSTDRSDRVGGTDVGHVLHAFARSDDIADHRLRENEQSAGADALNRARNNQLCHVMGERAQHRGADENEQRDDHEPTATVRVAQLAVDQRRRGRTDEVRHDDPGQALEPVQVACDRRQRRRNDRLVEGAEGDRHEGAAQ